VGVLEYFQSFPDVTGDGVPDVPEKYREKLDRQRVEASWNPFDLLRRGNRVTWIACGAIVAIVLISVLIAGFILRRVRR
jgi:hypothetical protein